jgi:hypothetical protein
MNQSVTAALPQTSKGLVKQDRIGAEYAEEYMVKWVGEAVLHPIQCRGDIVQRFRAVLVGKIRSL